MCNGGCPKDRIIQAPDGEPGLNYLCAGYRRFFRHCRPYTERMAALLWNGQQPDALMEQLRAEDMQALPACRAQRSVPVWKRPQVQEVLREGVIVPSVMQVSVGAAPQSGPPFERSDRHASRSNGEGHQSKRLHRWRRLGGGRGRRHGTCRARAGAAGRRTSAASGRGPGGQGLLQRDLGRDRADARAQRRYDRRLRRAAGGHRHLPGRRGRASHARLGRADHRDHPQVRAARLHRHLPEPALPRRQGDARGELRERARGRRHARRPLDGRHRRRDPVPPRPAATERQGGDHRLLLRRPAGLPRGLHAQGHRRRSAPVTREASGRATRGSRRGNPWIRSTSRRT